MNHIFILMLHRTRPVALELGVSEDFLGFFFFLFTKALLQIEQWVQGERAEDVPLKQG